MGNKKKVVKRNKQRSYTPNVKVMHSIRRKRKVVDVLDNLDHKAKRPLIDDSEIIVPTAENDDIAWYHELKTVAPNMTNVLATNTDENRERVAQKMNPSEYVHQPAASGIPTAGTGPKFIWNIHFWLGKDSTQDESGAAAILTANLDDCLFNGAAIQHRETQGYESKQFMDYFPPAIRYLEGGHASGFSHVIINAGAQKRLFHIKGKKHVRVRQVEASIKSMNKGDCFILDVDHTIYVFIGEKASHMEKLKANSVANHIRDQDHNGRGCIEIIDPYSSDKDTEKFFTALGSGSIDAITDEKEGGDDEEFEQQSKEPILCEISDRTGDMKLTELQKPFKRAQLCTNECYILDTGSNGIYVWVGNNSNDKENSEAMKRAEEYLKINNLPSWVHVSKVPEGMEPAAFKQYLSDWK